MHLERASRLLVDLRDAVVRGGGAADVAPAVRLQGGPHRDAEAVDLEAAAIHEPRGLHRRRLDDRGLARLVRQPFRDRNVFELASSGPGRRGRASGREGEGEERGDRALNAHAWEPSRARRGVAKKFGPNRLDGDVLATENRGILSAAESERKGTSGEFSSSR